MIKKKDYNYYIFPKEELEKLDKKLNEVGLKLYCQAVTKDGSDIPILIIDDLRMKWKARR